MDYLQIAKIAPWRSERKLCYNFGNFGL